MVVRFPFSLTQCVLDSDKQGIQECRLLPLLWSLMLQTRIVPFHMLVHWPVQYSPNSMRNDNLHNKQHYYIVKNVSHVYSCTHVTVMFSNYWKFGLKVFLWAVISFMDLITTGVCSLLSRGKSCRLSARGQQAGCKWDPVMPRVMSLLASDDMTLMWWCSTQETCRASIWLAERISGGICYVLVFASFLSVIFSAV